LSDVDRANFVRFAPVTKKWQPLPIDFNPNRVFRRIKMKHQILLSVLTAIIIFAATTTAEAGIFGRLSVVWNGCNPCEPVACQPCEVVACQPCEVVACDPCESVCGDLCGYRPFRPFGGLFANMKTKLACQPCEVVACQPCEVVACQPCEVVACDPCEAACGPCLPFGGFFMNLKAKLAAHHCAPGCEPCEAVMCEPCHPCK
jgi:hypothetical protein